MGRMSHEVKGSLGPQLDKLRFDVIHQANDILERISDIENRLYVVEKTLGIKLVKQTKEEIVYEPEPTD